MATAHKKPAEIDPRQWLGSFDLESFRSGQEDVIRTVLQGRDTLCIMPTGGGKSLCYQLPAVASGETTIVVSPLIALMKDQVDSLSELGIPSTFINSSLSHDEQRERIYQMKHGEFRLVYVAPERLRSVSFMRAIRETNIRMLAIDEAHCISHWGHDFRPDYARLGRFRERLGNPTTIALTATATELVREDICKVLNLDNPATYVSGFARDNLSLRVEAPPSNTGRDQRLVEFLQQHPGSGIIYASTRKNCEQVVELLQDEIGRRVEFYHAGLAPDKRRKVQEQFMLGEIPVIVATNAFGMGIDKADLRFVVHYNLPGSLEAYYQEAGRAGRDGLPSECLLLHTYQDRFIQQFFIENSYPSREVVKQVYDYLRSIKSDPIEMTLMDIKDEIGLSIGGEGISTCENLLEKAGAIERLDSKQNMAAIKISSELPSLVDYLPRDAKTQRRVMRKLEQIVGPMRGERVLFSPIRMAEDLEMKWSAINRAIRQIVILEDVDYVPPFRGRAIHMLSREKRFSELNIDFGELERRKQAEFDKLARMIQFASTRQCRQLEILDYFGDPERKVCRRCDNCGAGKSKKSTRNPRFANSDACLYAAQVTLSGVARTHGRFGKSLIAQMLAGSTAKKVKSAGLQKLSTFGLLSRLKQADVTQLLDWLIDFRYLKQVENTKFRPVVQISVTGKELMTGKSDIDLRDLLPDDLVQSLSLLYKDKKPVRMATPAPIPTTDHNNSVDEPHSGEVDALNDVHDSTSDASVSNSSEPETTLQESIPTDQALPDVEHTEEVHPKVDFEMDLGASGDQTSTPATQDKMEPPPYDPAMFVVDPPNKPSAPRPLAQFQDQSSVPPQSNDPITEFQSGSKPDVGRPSDSAESNWGDLKPSFYWTWKLLSDGYGSQDIQQIRHLEIGTIYDHAIRAGENNLPIDEHWLLSTSQINQLRDFVESYSIENVNQNLTRLPEGVSAQQLKFFLVSQQKTKSVENAIGTRSGSG